MGRHVWWSISLGGKLVRYAPREVARPVTALLSGLLAIAALPTAHAASCAAIPAWTASTIYNPGDKLVYQNHLYQANIQIWNAPPTHCPTCGWYTDLGTCDTGGTNQPPSASLTAPANGGSYSAGSSIAVTANASDSDGTVSKVEFFRGTTSLGVDTSAPYAVTWANATAGTHAFKAVATDNQGASTTSATSTITVTGTPPVDTTPPSVPTGLAAGALSSSSIGLSWNASTDNTGGTGVAGYDVYRNGSLVASPTTTSYTSSGLAANTSYSFTVRARDNASPANASAQSGAVSATTLNGGGGGNKRVIGYFVQWGIYGRNYRVKNIDTSGSAAKLTHINYAFGNVRNNRCEVGVTQASIRTPVSVVMPSPTTRKAFGAGESVSGTADTWDQPLRGSWNQLKQLKAKHPNLKVLISLGGWTCSRNFSSAASPANRQAFVASCVDAYIKGNLPVTDGAGGPGRQPACSTASTSTGNTRSPAA